MNTWIFQCNPDRFDVDAYLVFSPRRITWQVNQSWNQIREGDQVFLWRARGNGIHGPPGIIAECRVASQVTFMTDEPEGRPFWRAAEGADEPRRRVWLSVTRVAAKDAVVRRDVLEQDPALAGMGPMGFGNATNFVVEPERVGRLNFIWQQEFISHTAQDIQSDLDGETSKLEELPLSALLQAYAERRASNPSGIPRASEAIARVFERDPYVRAIARRRARFACEVPGCRSPTFVTRSGATYCEVHHLVPLADGGTDTIENSACVCANHHRELHVGTKKEELTATLMLLRR